MSRGPPKCGAVIAAPEFAWRCVSIRGAQEMAATQPAGSPAHPCNGRPDQNLWCLWSQ